MTPAQRKPFEPIDATVVADVLQLLRDGVRVAEITGKLGVSTFTVYKIKKLKLASGELKPRATAMSQTFADADELAPIIERLTARGAMLEASDDPSQLARAQLCWELARGLQNAAARAQLLVGRRAAIRKRRASDIVLSIGAAA